MKCVKDGQRGKMDDEPLKDVLSHLILRVQSERVKRGPANCGHESLY
jgi:hypothetical protein